MQGYNIDLEEHEIEKYLVTAHEAGNEDATKALQELLPERYGYWFAIKALQELLPERYGYWFVISVQPLPNHWEHKPRYIVQKTGERIRKYNDRVINIESEDVMELSPGWKTYITQIVFGLNLGILRLSSFERQICQLNPRHEKFVKMLSSRVLKKSGSQERFWIHALSQYSVPLLMTS